MNPLSFPLFPRTKSQPPTFAEQFAENSILGASPRSYFFFPPIIAVSSNLPEITLRVEHVRKILLVLNINKCFGLDGIPIIVEKNAVQTYAHSDTTFLSPL